LSLLAFLFSFIVNNGFCLVAFLRSFPFGIVILLFSGSVALCADHIVKNKKGQHDCCPFLLYPV
jgi:hypothetical protein